MYFQVDEVKRRYQQQWYKDSVTNWTTAPDNQMSWNYKRGLFAGFIGVSVQQYWTNFVLHLNQMLRVYEHPIGLKNQYHFFKTLHKLDSFKTAMRTRMQYAFFNTIIYVAPVLAAFRYFNSGWTSPQGFMEVSFYRKGFTTFLAAFITSPLGVIVDMAFRIHQSQLTFPPELRKDYKSYGEILGKVPFNEGIYYFYKNTFPLFAKHILGSFSALYMYDFSLDKMTWLEMKWSHPHQVSVLSCAALSAYMAALISYPLSEYLRVMVDLEPIKGRDHFLGNYRKAVPLIWFTERYEFLSGFVKHHLWHYGVQWFFVLIYADHVGFFRYWRLNDLSGVANNTYEGQGQ